MSDPNPQAPQVAARPASQAAQPANGLRDRLGSRFGRIDPDAIAKAEAALRGLSSQFGQWLQDEVTKLETARAAIKAQGVTPQTTDQIYGRAHDLKGLGTTYEFPIVTEIAGSLCKLLGDKSMRSAASVDLIEAHVDAISAMVRDDVKTSDDPVGRTVVSTLEARVQAHLKQV